MKASQFIWAFLLAGVAAKLPAQTINTQPTNQVVIIGGKATFSVAVSGTGPFTYQWQFNGTNLPVNIITTVAGNGVQESKLYGGVFATNVGLNSPYCVAITTQGEMLIADTGNNAVRRVDTNGIITTLANSSGVAGYSGDGGYADLAKLNSPEGLAISPSGKLYVADLFNSRIRMLSVQSRSYIYTYAGNGTNGFSGDGGPASKAGIFWAEGAAFDHIGNLFIADYGNGRIRKVDTNGIITTIAGNGTQKNLGDGGAATNASIYDPTSIALDAAGNVYVASEYADIVRKIDTNGIITTFAGNGTHGYSGDGGAATDASLSYPSGIAVDSRGNLLIADFANRRVRQVDPNGIITTIVGNGIYGYSGDGGPATDASLADPVGVTTDSEGNLFVADIGSNVIRKVTPFGSLPILTLKNVTTNNDGYYQVVVTGTSGSVTSSIATLTATTLPIITSQPQSVSITNGHPAWFTVGADGWPSITYQWYCNGTNLPNATNTSFTLPNAFPADAGNYTVVITNAYGSTTSNPAILAETM